LKDVTTEYNKEVFIVQYDDTDPADIKATINTLTSLTGGFYNLIMDNQAVADRYDLPNNATFFNDVIKNRFMASLVGSHAFLLNTTNTPVTLNGASTPTYLHTDDFTSPNFDNGGNYSIVNSRYSAPEDGNYLFRVTINIDIETTSLASDMRVKQTLQVGFPISQVVEVIMRDSIGNDILVNAGSYELTAEFNLTLATGDLVIARPIKFELFNAEALASKFIRFTPAIENTFECLQTPSSGATITKDSKDYKASIYSFEKKLSNSQLKQLIATPQFAFNINDDGFNNVGVWANNITLKLKDNTGEFETLTNLI
jgi:hypothetical protein